MTLQLQQLTKTYGNTPVFKEVSLQVAKGEFIAIMGPSGVGKSTLLNCMAGLDDWDSGSVIIDGQDISHWSADQKALMRRNKIGFVFQAFHVLPHLDVAQNVGLSLLLQNKPALDPQGIHPTNANGVNPHRSPTVADRVQAMLESVGLAGLGGRLPAQLSGGQLQRVAIARALIHQPALLLADEPTGNLDPETAAMVMQVLVNQTRSLGASLVLVTHSTTASQLADRVVLMQPS